MSHVQCDCKWKIGIIFFFLCVDIRHRRTHTHTILSVRSFHHLIKWSVVNLIQFDEVCTYVSYVSLAVSLCKCVCAISVVNKICIEIMTMIYFGVWLYVKHTPKLFLTFCRLDFDSLISGALSLSCVSLSLSISFSLQMQSITPYTFCINAYDIGNILFRNSFFVSMAYKCVFVHCNIFKRWYLSMNHLYEIWWKYLWAIICLVWNDTEWNTVHNILCR